MSNVRKFKRHRFRLLKKLVVTAIILVGLYFLIFDLFRVTHIVVEGSDRYTEEEIKNYMMTDRLDQNSLYFFVKYRYRQKPDIPFIQDVGIQFVDKNTIQVTLYEKIITGCVEYMGEYMYFDKDGIVVETSQEREPSVPLILGLKFTRIALNEQIQIQKQSLFQVILDLTKLIKEYELDVNDITFDSDYEVTLTCGKNIVLLGKHDYYGKPLSQLKNIMAAKKGAYCYNLKNYTEPGQSFIANKIEE